MQQETKELEKGWHVCMEVVGRKCMDNATLSEIKLTDEIADECVKEMDRNEECESMLDQTDCWMGRRTS